MPNELTPSQQRWNKFGIMNTGFAMLGQAIFATLLIFNALDGLAPPVVNYLLTPITLFTAFMGKYKIVRFFNRDAFLGFADGGWKQNLHPRHWSLRGFAWGFFNKLFALNISALFLFLSNVAYRDSAALINDEATSWVKDWRLLPALLLMGGLQSLLANLLGFGGQGAVHDGGIQAIKNLLSYPLLDSAQRKKTIEDNAKIDAVFAGIKTNFQTMENSTENETLNNLVTSLKKIKLLEQNATVGNISDLATHIKLNAERNQVISAYDSNSNTHKQYLSSNYWVLKLLITAATTGITLLGMLNFKDIWWAVFQDYNWKTDTDHQIATFLGIPAFISMILMSLIAGPLTAQKINHAFFEPDSNIQLLSKKEQIWMVLKILFITSVGSAANGYQALKAHTKIAGNTIAGLVFSMLGIVTNEFAGYFALEEQAAISKKAKLDPDKATIAQAINEAHHQAKTPEEPTRYRPWVQSLVTFFKECNCLGTLTTERSPLLVNK